MNDDLLTPDDVRMLDRLVDGELNETERRALLLRLEHSPDGWRRCALAFLEAQAWRLEARAVVAEPAPPIVRRNETADGAHSVQSASAVRKAWNGLSVWIPTVMAACVLATVVYVQFGGPENRAGDRPVVQFQNPQAPIATPGYETAAARSGERLRLVVAPGPGGEQRIVEVPLLEPERVNPEMMSQVGMQLPSEVVRMLEQNGNRVIREQRLMPITLKDGRRAVVPVEQVEIRPASLQGFQ
jgi:anti-sigma-K factor RskA